MNVKYNWIVRKSRSKLGACMFTGTNNDSISKWLQIPVKPAYWQTDWQIGRQRTNLLANWQIVGWQARWQTGWSADKPTGWLTSWLQTGWLAGEFAYWQTDWQTGGNWLTHWLAGKLAGFRSALYLAGWLKLACQLPWSLASWLVDLLDSLCLVLFFFNRLHFNI